jgi:hypothetical protein
VKRFAIILFMGVIMCGELLDAARGVLPYLNDNYGIGAMTLEYRTPADSLRRAADRMEAESAAKDRLYKAINDCDAELRRRAKEG